MEHEVREHKVVEQIPWRETCFGCNDGASEGVGMRAYVTGDGYVVGLCRAKTAHQGFPDTVHGGIIATYFDEVLWHATRVGDSETIAMTVEIKVTYLRPVDIGQELRIVAEPARAEGRHIHVDGFLLLEDGQTAAKASAHYIMLRPGNGLNQTETCRVKHPQTSGPETVRF